MPLTPEQLDLMRRSADLTLDAEGEILHEGTPILHPGLHRLFHAGLERLPDGAGIVRVGEQFAYLRTPGTPFVVQRWRVVGDGVDVHLNTGEALTLAIATLTVRLDGAHTLLVALPDGRDARLGRRAWTAVSGDLAQTDDGALQLTVGGRTLSVTTDTAA